MVSRQGRVQHPTKHITGHVNDDLPSQSLDWCKRPVFPINHLAGISKQNQTTTKLENVAINDVLPRKATRRDAIAKLKCFWGLGHQRPNFNGYIYIHYAAPAYSARNSAIYFLPFGNVWLGSASLCNAWEVQCRTYERWVRTVILF